MAKPVKKGKTLGGKKLEKKAPLNAFKAPTVLGIR
jgi:hypothetical protein